jgi:hypothetical protein
LIHEHLARRMPELVTWTAQTRRGTAEAQKICVVHFAEPAAHVFKSEWLESCGAHEDLLSMQSLVICEQCF